MDRLIGKIAIVTGGASGIGLGIAKGFASEGARICVADIAQAKCDAAAKEVGNGAFGQALDVRDQQSINAMTKRVIAAAGRIDILVNCAGVFGMETIGHITEAEFDRIIGINTRGLLFTLQAVAKHMVAAKNGGTIVNIASAAGRRGAPGAAVYCASKAAVISISQSAAIELASHGIRVNTIAPGAVQTPMWDVQVEGAFNKVLGLKSGDGTTATVNAAALKRISTPDDYVGAATFLASAESDYMTGQCMSIDGGSQFF